MTGPHPLQSSCKTENPHGTVNCLTADWHGKISFTGYGRDWSNCHTHEFLFAICHYKDCRPIFQFVHRSPFFSACECEAHTHSDAGLGFFSWRSLLNVEINLGGNTQNFEASVLCPKCWERKVISEDWWGILLCKRRNNLPRWLWAWEFGSHTVTICLINVPR